MFSDSSVVTEHFPEALLLLDADGYIRYANKAVAALTGYSPAELHGNHLARFYPTAEDNIKANYELGMALKQGRWEAEGWKRRKDDAHFWCTMLLAPVYEAEGGQLSGYTCMLQDRSARKAAELNRREEEERYRLMVEGVKDYAIFMMSPEGNIMTWNEGVRRTKGYLAAEIIGRHFSTFYTAEDLADGKPARELVIARATGKYEEEGWRVRKNGSVFWANIVITTLYNEQNKLIGFSKVTRDLSGRKENEEHLRESEERYRSLVEQVTDYGIFLLDEKGRIVSWNEGARRMKGYDAQEIIGKYFTIFYPEEDILNGKPANELRIARTEGKYEEEGWRMRKDGSRFWANVVITAVFNPSGLHVGFSKVTRDLTERKQAESALRDSYDQYRRLTEELRHLNRELTYANQELEQFTSIVSHDLQEPIRTIRSFLQLMEMRLEEGRYEDLKAYTGKAKAAAGRMRELIHNLLLYSQLGKNELHVEQVPVEVLIREAMQNLETVIGSSGAVIRVETEVSVVPGDRVQLVQLLQNLISNALKFTDSRQPEIVIRCRMQGDEVQFSVADNGIGISEADYAKVFDIFRRLHAARDYPGTGIGLAICKKIVDRHRGKIWPESGAGKGTTFYFTLSPALSV